MSKLQLKIGDTIKVGRKEFVIQKGDFIMDNYNCLMFTAGDRRTLYYTKNGRYKNSHTYITLPKKLVKKIDFTCFIKIYKTAEESKTQNGLIYYKFL